MQTTNSSLELRKDLNETENDEEEKKVGRARQSDNAPNDYSNYDQSMLSSPDGPLN